jgi:hypothetical protein
LTSISFRQIPDAVLEVQRPGAPTEIYIFDPKYKLQSEEAGAASADGQPVKMDIDAMHAYRDAIRDEAGDRAVRYAGIMYPGPKVTYSAGLEALPAMPENPELLRQALRQIVRRCLGAEPSPDEATKHGAALA